MGNLNRFYPIKVWQMTAEYYYGFEKGKLGNDERSIKFQKEELISVYKRLFPNQKVKDSQTEYMMTKLLYEIWKEFEGYWPKIYSRFVANNMESKNIIQGPLEIMNGFTVYYKVPHLSKWKVKWFSAYDENHLRCLFYLKRENKQEKLRKIKKQGWTNQVFRISEFESITKPYY